MSSGTNALKLPHDSLQEINKLTNRMLGNNSNFAGGQMPELPYERNPILLLGSYLSNLSFAMQRVQPFLSRQGELM